MKVDKRPTRDDILIEVAQLMARRSTCVKPNGAVVAIEGRIISTGYNGSPSGSIHCTDMGCLEDANNPGTCIRTVHAEANCIAFAARHGVSTSGSTIYCTSSPCYNCAKLLINAGIHSVVYLKRYKDERGISLLRGSNIKVIQWEPQANLDT